MNFRAIRSSVGPMILAVAAQGGWCSALLAQTAGEPSFTNSIGMEFVRVPAGTFQTGAAPGSNIAGLDYDRPSPGRVTLTSDYYLLKSAVSQKDYSRASLLGDAGDVSWNNAAAFCAWLSQKEGRKYRLPTEAEWDRARLQGDASLELSGREWVADWHGVWPVDEVSDPIGPPTGLTKVIRHGSQRDSLSPDASHSPWELPPTRFRIVLETASPQKSSVVPPPFTQSAVKQNLATVLQGPNPKEPYFKVRFALPIPPENDPGLNGPLAGLDPAVLSHQHSPGFEILPNGDALAIYFSAKNSVGASESENTTRFVQARLRHGAEEWDPPELFCDFKPFNDQSALLWRDGNTIRFFGGGRGMSDRLPFKMATSTNNGATWTMSLPYLDAPAKDYTAQPIVNAFRAGSAIYFAMDAQEDQSFLWRSLDEGKNWHDMGGRTGGRHSTIVPLDADGRLLSLGGKNNGVDGWTPQNVSSNWGAGWSASVASAFPALGGNQRPCLVRLSNGHLCFVSDSYHRKKEAPPAGWTHGEGCFVAISTNNGGSWHSKLLPIGLPHEADRKRDTLGYATARQAPNGVIHVLATMTHPCLHYEFNEAWILSAAQGELAESQSGLVEAYSEKYADGSVRASWSAKICPGGRYLLQGVETTFYENGRKEHEATFASGRKTGLETFWGPDGTKIWSWTHHPESNTSTWVRYWNNGQKRIESKWNTRPRARDRERSFFGLAADGPAIHFDRSGNTLRTYTFVNGFLEDRLRVQSRN
jgi:hypothetical protein